MSEYRLIARYGYQKIFQTVLYDDLEQHDREDSDISIDPSLDSALYEREWYCDWAVVDNNGMQYTLLALSANGAEIDLNVSDSQPFLMQYGLIRFRAEIMNAPGNRQILCSKFCSALNSSDNENIEQMVRRISEVKEPVLSMLRWPSRSAGEGEPQSKDDTYSMVNGLSSRGDSKGVPSSLGNIIDAYQRNAPYFRAKPEHTIRKNTAPVPIHRVRTLSRDSMLWSVQTGKMHPMPPGSSSGVQVGDTRYMPRETLTELSVKDHHIYENLVIVGFLDTVHRQLRNTEWMEQRGLNGNGFDILRMILYPETQHTFDSVMKIENLRKQYQHSLQLDERKIPIVLSLPNQTKRFQEIPSYHDIYQRIYEWFRGGSALDWGNGAIFKGRLADTIYEYFCWQEILNLFAQKGFKKCKPSVRAGYRGKRQKPPFSNVVFLHKDKTFVTLYFEPWIPAVSMGEKPMHGIALVRTDSVLPGKGYSPDFLIKVEREDQVAYAVLDAKFRDMDRLFARRKPQNSSICAMEETLQKYYINLSAGESLHRPVKMVWLLQGRCVPEGTYDVAHQSRSIGKGDPDAALEYYPESFFKNLSWGAMPLNAGNTSEWANHFWSVFSAAML